MHEEKVGGFKERWWAWVKGLGYVRDGMASIGEGMMNIFSFGRTYHVNPEIEEILARSDREALLSDWYAIAGDFDAVGRQMNTSLEWFGAAVERAEARGTSIADMLDEITQEWREWVKREAAKVG